jgi:hypothetical protein
MITDDQHMFLAARRNVSFFCFLSDAISFFFLLISWATRVSLPLTAEKEGGGRVLGADGARITRELFILPV